MVLLCLTNISEISKVTARLFVDSGPLEEDLGWVLPLRGQEGFRLALGGRPS